MSLRSLTIQTNDTIVTSGEEVGKISFAASAESDGGSAISVGGRVIAQAESAFQSATNPTSLVFATAAPNAAVSGKIKVTDYGHVVPMVNNTFDLGDPNLRYRNTYAASGYFSNRIATSGSVFFMGSGNSAPVGVMQWDDGEGTATLGLKGGNTTVNLAQDNVILANNGTAGSLTKGQVVYVSGAQGQRPQVNLALATTDLTSARTIGVVNETITTGSEGFITTFGVVRNVDTSAFTPGSGLWLSATTPGGLSMVRPVAPNHGVFVGWCLSSNASSGRIFVEVQNGYELEEIHDVSITSPASGDILRYDSSNSTWKNVSLAAATSNWSRKTANYTAVNGDRIIADTSGGAWTLTLPASPLTGNYIQITDGNDFEATNLTVARNGSTIEGISDDVLLTIGRTTYDFIYDGTTWEVVAAVGTSSGVGGGGSGVSDGDKGDITVSSNGATWTIDNDVVTNAKLANMATETVKARKSAGTGDPEDLGLVDARLLLRRSKFSIPNTSGTYTLDLASGLFQEVTLSGNMTLNFPTSVTPGETCFLYVLKSTAASGAQITFASGYQTPGGVSLQLSTSSGNLKDRFEMFFDTTTTATVTMTKTIRNIA